MMMAAALALAGCRTMNTETRLQPVVIDRTDEVTAYYPQFTSIDLVCETMPPKSDRHVIFCAEAAFTHALLDHFEHTNIDGDHVSGGKRWTGAKCKDNSGAFIYYNKVESGKSIWRFVRGDYNDALDEAAANGGMGFGQALIVYNGERITPLWRKGNNYYRALCERNGRLCIVDSRTSVDYDEFVNQLMRYGVTHALYLDMGSGWNHSWWRDAQGTAHDIHPWIEKCRFCTNWIAFVLE